MKKILFSFFITAVVLSCKQPATNTSMAKAPVDSLMKAWADGWSGHDSAAVMHLFTADALLMDDNLVAAGAERIAAKWISPNIRVVNNFKATGLQQWSAGDRAGYSGKYEFDVIVKDSVVAKPAGAFTINWIKGDKGDWKITTAAIHSFMEKK